MTQTVQAVYQGGVLRPVQPLALDEGETVEITVAKPVRQGSLAQWEKDIRAANSIQEWIALANACPNPETDFDIVKAINETRRLTGFRLPDPEPEQGGAG
jgi:predicted DNA-binding antitoxin AbrB/MazE fold protein